MRIKITINHLPNQKLPLNYQYLVSSWIYSCLHQADSKFANWLHEKGYELNGKRYKHFCFSKLHPRKYKIDSQSGIFELVEAPTELVLSFNIDQALQNMVKSLFQNNFIELKSGNFFNVLGQIGQVQLLPKPEFKTKMHFRAETPICISVGRENSEHPEYLSPLDERYADAFAQNLCDKANAISPENRFTPDMVKFKLISNQPKSKLLKIKGISVKGYEFDFELEAPPELMEIGYNAGFGVMNASLGMGFCIEK